MSTQHVSAAQPNRQTPRRQLWCLAGCVIVFALIAWQIQTDGPLVHFDLWFQKALQAARNRTLISAASWLTLLGNTTWAACIALLASVPLMLRRQWIPLAGLWIAIVGAGLSILLLKGLIYRPRPVGLDDVIIGSSSFPSGNSIFAAAVFGAIALIVLPQVFPRRSPRFAIFCVAMLPVLVAASRVILSVHFVSDTIAGLAVGLAWALIGAFVSTLKTPTLEHK